MTDIRRNERGALVVSVIIIAAVLTVTGLSLMTFVSSQYTLTRNNIFVANAEQVAEAGIEQSVLQLNQDDAFGGYVAEQVFFDNESQGRGVFTTTVVDGTTDDEKIITSTARVYRGDSSQPAARHVIKVTAVGTGSDGYSVYTGVGGLILGGSANITNSDVFVNGTITMNGTAKIGTHANPLNVHVAHQSCPTGNNPGPTYPLVCDSGQPISMAWSTNIYGTVCATNQTSLGPNPSGNIQPGSSGQGLVSGCVTPPVTLPTFDRAAHIAGMTTTANANSNTYVCNNWPFTRSWPDKLRLNGNVSVASSCDVTINGDVYISGDLNIGGAAKITVADSVGADRPVVVVDGKITVGGSGRIIANSAGTGIQFISFKSAAACGPACTSLSGTELKSSQVQETIDIGGNVNLPGMIFQAYWGKITVAGSGSIGSALGQTVDLSGAGTVTFGTTLSSGARTWTITSYQQKFTN